jgi:mannitol 2-dehydrogenase
VRWSERGIWEGIFGALAGASDASDRRFIDSSCIKVHRCAGGENVWLTPLQAQLGMV